MGIITKYLIRAHVGPFVFALTALTALIFLNAVAQRLDLLAGKGLSWSVIGEFLLLSLPHTVALTLPMAILVAVLYTFAELTSANELTAMAAGGVKPVRLLLPLVGVGIILGGVMFIFNDHILPESNHRLKGLMSDLVRKSPTFELREQVVNEIKNANGQTAYYLQATTIDPETNDLTDVVIYDVSDAQRYRTVYAERGTMAFSSGRTDLFLTLYDGVIHEVDNNQPGGFQRNFYETQVIKLQGVADELERQLGSGQRSDREMNTTMLRERVVAQQAQIVELRGRTFNQSRAAVRQALGIEPEAGTTELDAVAAGPSGRGALAERGEGASAMTAGSRAAAARRVMQSAQAAEARRTAQPGQAPGAGPSNGAGQADLGSPSDLGSDDFLVQQALQEHQASNNRLETLELNAASYEVEIHKKWAIAFACIIFVLLGAPLAMRFQRGGVGMVIGMSLLIFGIYWVGLLGGERLADRGKADPFLAMWGANFLFMLVAAWLLSGFGKAGGTNRGGGFDEVIFRMKRRTRRLFGRNGTATHGRTEARAGAEVGAGAGAGGG